MNKTKNREYSHFFSSILYWIYNSIKNVYSISFAFLVCLGPLYAATSMQNNEKVVNKRLLSPNIRVYLFKAWNVIGVNVCTKSISDIIWFYLIMPRCFTIIQLSIFSCIVQIGDDLLLLLHKSHLLFFLITKFGCGHHLYN